MGCRVPVEEVLVWRWGEQVLLAPSPPRGGACVTGGRVECRVPVEEGLEWRWGEQVLLAPSPPRGGVCVTGGACGVQGASGGAPGVEVGRAGATRPARVSQPPADGTRRAPSRHQAGERLPRRRSQRETRRLRPRPRAQPRHEFRAHLRRNALLHVARKLS